MKPILETSCFSSPSASIWLVGLIRKSHGLGRLPSSMVTLTELAVSTTWGTPYFLVTLALTARVGELPQAAIMRSTLSRVTSFSAALTDWAGSLAPSSMRSWTCLPMIPPSALNLSRAISTPALM